MSPNIQDTQNTQKLGFFTPIAYNKIDGAGQKENCSFLRFTENYLTLSGRRVKIVEKQTGFIGKGNTFICQDTFQNHSNFLVTTLKVISYATIILPLLTLIGKAIYRWSNDFQLKTLTDEELIEKFRVIQENKNDSSQILSSQSKTTEHFKEDILLLQSELKERAFKLIIERKIQNASGLIDKIIKIAQGNFLNFWKLQKAKCLISQGNIDFDYHKDFLNDLVIDKLLGGETMAVLEILRTLRFRLNRQYELDLKYFELFINKKFEAVFDIIDNIIYKAANSDEHHSLDENFKSLRIAGFLTTLGNYDRSLQVLHDINKNNLHYKYAQKIINIIGNLKKTQTQ